MVDNAQEEFRRYAGLVAAALAVPPALDPEAEGAAAVQVERGTVFPLCLLDPADAGAAVRVGRLIDVARLPGLAAVAVVDRLGHRRPVYRPLLVYSWLQAFRLAYEALPRAEFGRWEEGLRPWCDLLEGELTGMDWDAAAAPAAAPTGGIPAARGASATQAAWSALALFVAGKVYVRDAWMDLASDTFGRLTRAQAGSGAMLQAGASDNPETRWFHELVLLHAAASYAVQAEDRAVATAVSLAAEHHQRETEPDHATGHPWGLFAFAWGREARPLADLLLHAAGIRPPGRSDGVASILLADALYCLQLFG